MKVAKTAPVPITRVEWSKFSNRLEMRIATQAGELVEWDRDGIISFWINSIANDPIALINARSFFARNAIHVFNRLLREARALVRS